MYTIENTIDIAAPLATVLAAVTTKEGFRGWWTKDTECDSAKQEATFGFRNDGKVVTFKLDHLDDRGIAMTCIRETNNPDWLGTKLAITLAPSALGTRVRLVHDGYAAKNECFERCVKGWAFFLASLAKYATTGTGEPYAAAA